MFQSRSALQNCSSYSSIVRSEKVWRDRNITLRSNITSHAFSRDIDLPVCMRNLDTDRLPSTQHTSNGDSTEDSSTYCTIQSTSQIRRYATGSSMQLGHTEDLLTTVKRRKLKWYGHVSRSSGLSKTIMQRTVNGSR